jgi:nicotinamidase-related amidase
MQVWITALTPGAETCPALREIVGIFRTRQGRCRVSGDDDITGSATGMASAIKAPLTPRSVNVCIDMQRLFGADGPWPTPWLERRRDTIVGLAARFPERVLFTRFVPPEAAQDMPRMWRRFYERWPDATRARLDPSLIELISELGALVPPALVFDKPVYSPFSGTSFPRHLAERQADALVISGAETDVCVLATILGAVDHGYRVILATDAVCSSSDEGHDALLTLLGNRFTEQIELASTAEILDAWQR